MLTQYHYKSSYAEIKSTFTQNQSQSEEYFLYNTSYLGWLIINYHQLTDWLTGWLAG